MGKEFRYNDKTKSKSSKFNKHDKRNKPKSKSNNCDRIDSDGVVNSPRINDASYYFASDVLKSQLAKISFNQFNGVPNNLGSLPLSTGDIVTAYDKTPYIMAIELSPSAGFTGGAYTTVGNGINLAALNLYTTLSANNAKTSNYAPQDLTTLLLAFGSVISLSSHVTRLFGLAYLYNMRNRAFPREVIEAAGCDYDDLITNLAEYRIRFNNLMVAASKIPVPGNIPYFTKCAKIYSGIYWDMEGSDLAQTYLFTPGTTWLFSEEYNEEGTGLSTLGILDPNTTEGKPSMDFLLNTLDDMIGRLLNSATLNAIYSDVLRVSQKEGLPMYQLGTVSETYVVLPSYDPEIRRWINNATPMGYPVEIPTQDGATPYNDVVPEVAFNRIAFKPEFQPYNPAHSLNMYINFDAQNPSDDEIIEATRLTARAKVEFNGTRYVTTDVALPDHYVNRLVIYRPDVQPTVITEPVIQDTQQLCYLSAFDWAPIMYYLVRESGFGATFGDLNYYTTLDYDYVARLHDATYLGLMTIR